MFLIRDFHIALRVAAAMRVMTGLALAVHDSGKVRVAIGWTEHAFPHK